MKSKVAKLASITLLICVFIAATALVGCECPFKKDSKSSSMETQQTTCPVSGKPINKEYSTQYKGKTVYFCCPNCKPAFEKNPEKYVGKLPQFQGSGV
ncbi:MAG: YHS domain-containing protein [Sedimentisphaerales bacterium]|jgi:YHS domain-containing protein